MKTALRNVTAAIFLTGLVAPSISHASDIERQLWLDYNLTSHRSSKWDVFGDLGYRTTFEDPRFRRYVIRPNALTYWRDWKFMGGVGNFITWNDDNDNTWEVRPWQGAEVMWPRTKVRLKHLFRLEQRMTFDMDNSDDNTFSLRFRYRISYDINWTNPEKGSYWRTPLSLEGFTTLSGTDDEWSEDSRAVAAIDYIFGPRWTAGVDFTWQKSAAPWIRGAADEFYLRLRVFHTLSKPLLFRKSEEHQR